MLIIRDIHRSLRSLQIKYRRVRKGSELSVAIAEVHVLVELEAAGELTINELADSLLISQSQVSRIVQRLRSRRLISQRSDRADNRRVLSSLSREGRAMVTHIDEVMGGIFSATARRLRAGEQRQLAHFFERVAHGHGCTTIRVRRGESKLRACHRQMARVFGLLGGTVYGSDLTRSQWCILEAIMLAPEPINATIVGAHLGVKNSLISEIVTSFEAHGYIERVRSSDNHRVFLLWPSARGRKYFRRLETQAILKLRRVLKGTPSAALRHLHQLLRRFAGEWGRESIYLSQTLVTQRIESAQSVRHARAFALRELVARGWEFDAPDPLFGAEQLIWGLYDTSAREPVIRAVCAVSARQTAWDVTFGVWSDGIDANQFHAFLQHAHYLGSRKNSSAQLRLNFNPIS